MNRYKEIFNKKVEDIRNATNKHCVEVEEFCKSIVVEDIKSLVVVKELFSKIEDKEKLLQSIQIKFKVEYVKVLMDNEYNLKLSNIEKEKDRLTIALGYKLECLAKEISNERKKENELIRQKNQELIDAVNLENKKYSQVEAKKQRLMGYSRDILQLCSDYGIKTTDVPIRTEMFTINELDVYYDEFYDLYLAEHHVITL